jgi:hypothetical protein
MNVNDIYEYCRIPLLGRIDAHMVAIALKVTLEGVITIRFYLDKIPEDTDMEGAKEAASEIYTQLIDSGVNIIDVVGESVFSENKEYQELDPMDGFLFARLVSFKRSISNGHLNILKP